eukprot:TRINITY_DN63430_c0_g1_i2.p1 TRINITY_DN63430_c0_g1~~TRINITY_DN63430_c0_g1_i2.p1  ORF type:complete len:123 (-),score=19.28 TRINITY_DN63430_c0_g1_i2:3-371(-)
MMIVGTSKVTKNHMANNKIRCIPTDDSRQHTMFESTAPAFGPVRTFCIELTDTEVVPEFSQKITAKALTTLEAAARLPGMASQPTGADLEQLDLDNAGSDSPLDEHSTEILDRALAVSEALV